MYNPFLGEKAAILARFHATTNDYEKQNLITACLRHMSDEQAKTVHDSYVRPMVAGEALAGLIGAIFDGFGGRKKGA